MDAQAPSVESTPEQAIPLADLDRALSPVRRTVAWAVERGRVPGFAEATLSPWIHRALALDLPEVMREQLVEMAGMLGGIELLDEEAASERMVAIGVQLARFDAIAGLPIPGGPPLQRLRRPRVARRPRHVEADATETTEASESAATPTQAEAPAQAESSSSRSRRSRRDRRGGRRRSAPEPKPQPVAAPPEPKPRPSWQLSSAPRSLDEILDEDLADQLADVGIEDLQTLVLRQPVDVEVVRPILGAGRPIEAGRRALGGRVRSRCTRLRPDGTATTEVVLHGAGPVVATWDGVPRRVLERLPEGGRGVLVGRYEAGENPRMLDAEVARDDGRKAARLARYGVVGLPDEVMRDALLEVAPELEVLRDPLPNRVLRRGNLPTVGEALALVHYQADSRPEARQRLAFDEALGLWLSSSMGRFEGSRRRGLPHPLVHGLVGRLEHVLGIVPNDHQQLALDEIKRDLISPQPMLRLLTGDTGAGKGLVALLAAVHVAESKGQVLFDLPDAASAEYRFLFAEPLLKELGLVARLIHGEPSRGQRDAIKRGEVHVVFGHDLLGAQLQFRRLGLVVALEHEQDGATSEAILQLKAPRPDALVISTSQVPSEALVAHYAEHDISVLPLAHRAPMRVQVLPAPQRAVAYSAAAAALARQQQVIVIFPLVNGQDALDGRELSRVKAALESDAFPGSRVGVFHGGMARDERYATYEDFRRHRFDVLVSTGPIEMGPPVPRAAVTIIEQADRMDPIRLQRACRHLSKSQLESVETFFVTGDVPDPIGLLRAERVATRGDELQLVRELREGSLPEPPSTRFLDVRRDRELLLAAHQLLHASARTDPTLRRSILRDAVGDVEVVWKMLHAGETLDLPDRTGSGGRRRRRRRKRK
ncbi:MAG: hypothetical protein EP330_11980 [Deltaproteobacteria bacterium]|nr:MAG: hypothetical protein EP330_11980 [Deltaproteobacteria bacterium]